jgi:hypothetical protein
MSVYTFTIVGMNLDEILSTIDAEIAQLQCARAFLIGGTLSTSAKPEKKKKRDLTAKGRKRIAEAVKQRWVAHKKSARG